jgi:hypothetical protein
MASKKERFGIFKRDNFTCQYCGRTPPAVVLELDHIIPKSKGGINSTNNYITACFDCNRGKGKNELDNIPQSIKDKIDILKEKQKQLKAFNRYIEKQEKELTDNIEIINNVFSEYFPELELTDNFKVVSVKKFLTLLPKIKVEEAMRLACTVKANAPDLVSRYFCGICWNWIKKPETREW